MSTRRHSLVIFARAPQAGRVKTRLAAEIGDTAALTAYTRMANAVIDSVRQSASYSVEVAYTPSEEERAMRDWLGSTVILRPQAGGDLGGRMATAVEQTLHAGADRVESNTRLS